MTPQAWFTLAGLLVQFIVAAFVYGKLTGKVAEHDQRHNSHDARFAELGAEQNRQWETIGRHGEKISAIEALVQAAEQRRG